MADIEINGKKFKISTPLARGQDSKNRTLHVAGVGQYGANNHSSEGIYLTGEFYRNDVVGKPYPGRVNFETQRVLAYNSTVVRSIITLRAHQVAKLPITLVPVDRDEPPKQISVLEYNVHDIEHHPAFDYEEKKFLTRIFARLDPKSYIGDKKEKYEQMEDEFTPGERATIRYLQEKHQDFYQKRAEDTKNIMSLLTRPDPWFSNTNSWEIFIKKILVDLLVIDRGVAIKLRDENGQLLGLMPVDGATVRPLINEYGTFDPEKAYVQVINGTPTSYLRRDDVVVMSLHPMADMKYFGYGFSTMETLYNTVLSDIFIDKGNLDYYRKGGSIPEGFISIEPPPSREGMVTQLDQDQLETIQRQLQSIMMGDYTQVPLVSGGKVSWIDFKGKRKDMQFKELAEYLTRKICAAYQVSPQDVGILADINRATGQVQAEMTKSKGLETLMMSISSFITNEVIREIRPEGDLKLWFVDDDIQRDKERWTISQQQLVSGVISINQYRAKEGMHPVPWGNTPLQGIRNWKPEEDNQQGGPGAMPQLPGLPPLPGINNPGGPVGGANPMSGQEALPPGAPPPIGSPTNLKSTRFFAMAATVDDVAMGEELMIKGFSELYTENARFNDWLELHDIMNYPGSAMLRSPIESYEFFTRENDRFGVTVHKSMDVDEADPLVFSRYVGSGQVIVDEHGEEPLIKSLTKAIIDNLTQTERESIQDIVGSTYYINEAVERAVLNNLDATLKSVLHEDFYKFQSFNLTEAQVQEVGELLGLK